MIVHREARVKPSRPNQVWSLDFVHNQLSGGQKFRILTVVDVYSREGLATEVDYRLMAKMLLKFSIVLFDSAVRQSFFLRIMAQSLLVIS